MCVFVGKGWGGGGKVGVECVGVFLIDDICKMYIDVYTQSIAQQSYVCFSISIHLFLFIWIIYKYSISMLMCCVSLMPPWDSVIFCIAIPTTKIRRKFQL